VALQRYRIALQHEGEAPHSLAQLGKSVAARCATKQSKGMAKTCSAEQRHSSAEHGIAKAKLKGVRKW